MKCILNFHALCGSWFALSHSVMPQLLLMDSCKFFQPGFGENAFVNLQQRLLLEFLADTLAFRICQNAEFMQVRPRSISAEPLYFCCVRLSWCVSNHLPLPKFGTIFTRYSPDSGTKGADLAGLVPPQGLQVGIVVPRNGGTIQFIPVHEKPEL